MYTDKRGETENILKVKIKVLLICEIFTDFNTVITNAKFKNHFAYDILYDKGSGPFSILNIIREV